MNGKPERLRAEMAGIRGRRHKLLFLLPETAGASAIAGELESEGIPALNVSLLLSDKLRAVAPNKRPYEVAKQLRIAINERLLAFREQTLCERKHDEQNHNEEKNDTVCLYRIEYLFDLELKQNPVKLLEALAGNALLIVVWTGGAEQGVLEYAVPEHPEYYRNGEYGSCILPY